MRPKTIAFDPTQPSLRQGLTKIETLLSLGTVALAVLLLQPMLSGNKTAQHREACLSNLRQIGDALAAYLTDSGNRWPSVSKLASAPTGSPAWPTLPNALDRYLGRQSPVFACPADQRTLNADHPLRSRFPQKTNYFLTEGISYEWWFGEAYGGKKVGEESLGKAGGFGLGRSDQPLLSDFEPFHSGDDLGPINTLNADLKARTSRARPKA